MITTTISNPTTSTRKALTAEERVQKLQAQAPYREAMVSLSATMVAPATKLLRTVTTGKRAGQIADLYEFEIERGSISIIASENPYVMDRSLDTLWSKLFKSDAASDKVRVQAWTYADESDPTRFAPGSARIDRSLALALPADEETDEVLPVVVTGHPKVVVLCKDAETMGLVATLDQEAKSLQARIDREQNVDQRMALKRLKNQLMVRISDASRSATDGAVWLRADRPEEIVIPEGLTPTWVGFEISANSVYVQRPQRENHLPIEDKPKDFSNFGFRVGGTGRSADPRATHHHFQTDPEDMLRGIV